MINHEKLKHVISNLETKIANHHNDLLNMFPLKRYMNLIDQYPKIAGYGHCSNEVETYCQDIIRFSNSQTLELYHKLLLLTLISLAENKVKKKNLPDEVKQYYFRDFDRIICQIENDIETTGLCMYPNDSFCKDLAICSLRMFPIGGRKYHFCTFPVRDFLKIGGRQFVSILLFLLFETGGREPFLRAHYDTHDPNFMAEFTLEGLIYANRILAKVMKMNPHIKGKLGESWIGDPQLERISPRLSYIRYFNIANGAKYFYVGPSDDSVMHSTKKSATRMRLYKEGKYVPTDYMDVWSRKSMIKWVDKLKWYW